MGKLKKRIFRLRFIVNSQEQGRESARGYTTPLCRTVPKGYSFYIRTHPNAEDNSYAPGVEPQLDLVLTKTDITEVGASATLILFNNELGFQERNISALCSVGQSTKKGKRNEGYIGEKGIGFKSVFVVTSTPYIISNGFRIRFSDSGGEHVGSAEGIGYIVPKWVDKPSDEELLQFWRPPADQTTQNALPSTVIVLPLRPEKEVSVRNELKQISPETILFFKRITRLRIRNETGGHNHVEEIVISRSDSRREPAGNTAGFTSRVSVVKEPAHIAESCHYFLWEQRFDVPPNASVDQRREMKTWFIQLAFPHIDRIAGGSPGSVYAFLPSQLDAGLPFIVNADFLLVSSRETLKFDSPWNKGILDCVPKAFCASMEALVQGTSYCRISPQHIYKFVPVKDCHPQLKSIQQQIFRNLTTQEVIVVAENVGSRNGRLCRPSDSKRVNPCFRLILEKAVKERKITSAVSEAAWSLVHGSVQKTYGGALDKLDVPWMTRLEYIDILMDTDWLLQVSDELYLEILSFVSTKLSFQARTKLEQIDNAAIKSRINSLKLVKYQGMQGVDWLSLNDIKNSKLQLYVSHPQAGSHLCKWIERFSPWMKYHFLPHRTVAAIENKLPEHPGVKWLSESALVQKTDVKQFALEHVTRCTKSVENSSNILDPQFFILVWKFVYTSILEGELKDFPRMRSDFAVVDETGQVQWVSPNALVLLPRNCSRWPSLMIQKAWFSHSGAIIRMSNDYLTLHNLDGVVSTGFEMENYRMFLKENFRASDLPELSVPNIPVPQLADLNSAQSLLLLKWLNHHYSLSPYTFWESRKALLKSLQETTWLHTEQHGLRSPKICFMPQYRLTSLFNSSDVPFIDENFYEDVDSFSGLLKTLGVVNDPEYGIDAVTELVKKLMQEIRPVVTKEKIVKFYRYLNTFGHRPSSRYFDQVFIPAGTVTSGNEAGWVKVTDCIIPDPENYFKGVLPILSEIYPQDLLQFFEDVLQVPKVVSYARYYNLWILWRENLMQYDSMRCAHLWEKLALNWKNCDPSQKQTFKSKAAVLSVRNQDELHITPPASAYIPDDMQLRRIFMAYSTAPLFVWYPKGYSRFEAELNEVYEYLGVKKLADCVQVIFDMDVDTLTVNSRQSKHKFITGGLLAAILGLISDRKFGFSAERRRNAIRSLSKPVEKEMIEPCKIHYMISTDASEVTTTIDHHLFGFWDGKGVVYRLEETHELLTDAINIREPETQVLESICSKILAETPMVAQGLVDFLKLLVGCQFDEAAVAHELRRKNLKFYSEDLEFLQEVTNSLITGEMKLGTFRSLILG
ncbi:hypothetical protein R1flu_009287 [Riccia fluitans]|uniref:Sacsin/Nov domain-containing protein n=1 Tax=Riccia fluitans TaxID=41844 RepID=A0ABD1Z1M7_9MARC